jgi:hypothetical protein
MSATRYTYLGPAGTFTEAALHTLPEAATRELVPLASVPAALDAVRAGEAAGAFVPIENSVEGAVTATADELAFGGPLMIYREVLLPITFALLVRPGTELADIKTVTSHPVAQPQVRRWSRRGRPTAPSPVPSPPSCTGWTRWSPAFTTRRTRPPGSSWSAARPGSPHRPVRTRPRWWSGSATTTPVRCWNCCRNSRCAAST